MFFNNLAVFFIPLLAAMTVQAQGSAPTTTEGLVNYCKPIAIEKLNLRMKNKSCVLDSRSVVSKGIDDRWFNPSKYIWYAAKAECENGLILNTQAVVLFNPKTQKCH